MTLAVPALWGPVRAVAVWRPPLPLSDSVRAGILWLALNFYISSHYSDTLEGDVFLCFVAGTRGEPGADTRRKRREEYCAKVRDVLLVCREVL